VATIFVRRICQTSYFDACGPMSRGSFRSEANIAGEIGRSADEIAKSDPFRVR
jgi:hypothetical protein